MQPEYMPAFRPWPSPPSGWGGVGLRPFCPLLPRVLAVLVGAGSQEGGRGAERRRREGHGPHRRAEGDRAGGHTRRLCGWHEHGRNRGRALLHRLRRPHARLARQAAGLALLAIRHGGASRQEHAREVQPRHLLALAAHHTHVGAYGRGRADLRPQPVKPLLVAHRGLPRLHQLRRAAHTLCLRRHRHGGLLRGGVPQRVAVAGHARQHGHTGRVHPGEDRLDGACGRRS